MIKVSVIIPFFQRQPGILRRALTSILQQRLAQNITVNVIVVDDGSPIPAKSETEGLEFKSPFHLTIIPQPNAGVAAARNTGLKSVDADTTYIAFLDSDDSWHEDHLNQGVNALEQGYDFYFCDNEREGHSASNFLSGKLMLPVIERAPKDSIIIISREDITTITLKEFVTQASTVIYRRDIAPDLLFDPSFTKAGEDLIFFIQLINRAQKICFSPKIMVDCGKGINLYFSTFGWDNIGLLPRTVDRLRSHIHIKKTIQLTKTNTLWNDSFIATLRREFVFHILRYFIKNKGKWPVEAKILARKDKWFYAWFLFYAVQVSIGRALGVYHPT